jgi:hypothetical protein
MREPVCTPTRHLGNDGEGRCSVCNDRLGRSDLVPVGLLLIAVSSGIVLVILAALLLLLFL